jgi:hypothetical protein
VVALLEAYALGDALERWVEDPYPFLGDIRIVEVASTFGFGWSGQRCRRGLDGAVHAFPAASNEPLQGAIPDRVLNWFKSK